MDQPATLAALLALVAAPGPTNALLSLGGTGLDLGRGAGRRKAAALLGAAVCTYVGAIIAIGRVGGYLLSAIPGAATGLRLFAALWIAFLAVRLWHGQARAAVATSPRLVALTTLLNPKALVIALVLLPRPGAPGYGADLLMATAAIAAAGGGWMMLGHAAAPGAARIAGRHAGPAGGALVLSRVASCWLALVSAGILLACVAAWRPLTLP